MEWHTMNNPLTEWRLWFDGMTHNEQPFDGTGGSGLTEWHTINNLLTEQAAVG